MVGASEQVCEADEARQLVERIRTRDASALTQFYQQHVDGLYAFVFYRVGSDHGVAEDVVHDTFVAALERLEIYDPQRGTLRAWLCTLSRNVIRRYRRQKRVSAEQLAVWEQIDQTLDDLCRALDGAPLSDELVARAETRTMVSMTVANLPEQYRGVLLRKYIDGESLDELATALDVSPDAAKSLLARARRAFRSLFVVVSQAARSQT